MSAKDEEKRGSRVAEQAAFSPGHREGPSHPTSLQLIQK